MELPSSRSQSGLTGGKKAERSAEPRPEMIGQGTAERGAEPIGEFLSRVPMLDRPHLFDRVRRRKRRDCAGDRDVQSAKQTGDEARSIRVTGTSGVGLDPRRRGRNRM